MDGLKHNLLSISQLCDKGFKVIFEASHCIIKDIQNDKTIFMGHRCDNIYAINISKYDWFMWFPIGVSTDSCPAGVSWLRE